MKPCAVVFLLLLAGCSGGTEVAGPPADLAQARARWAAKGLRSYRFTVQKACFCAPEYTQPVTITVREGVAADSPAHLKPYDTVEKLQGTIQTALDGGAESVNVTYTPDGWPSAIAVDPSHIVADGGYSLTVTDLTPL